jgi:hypothetical protein
MYASSLEAIQGRALEDLGIRPPLYPNRISIQYCPILARRPRQKHPDRMLASYACAISSGDTVRGFNQLDLTSSAHAQVLAADDMFEVNVWARAVRAHLACKRDEHGLQSP